MAVATLALVLCGVAVSSLQQGPRVTEAWWAWAGIALDELPAEAPLYLYQGLFLQRNGIATFEPRGYFPHPLKRGDIALVFRLQQLPPADYVLRVINARLADWQRHGVTVTEVQLDFDAPSARLTEYAAYLEQVRKGLHDAIPLSITGLGTWLLDAEPAHVASLYRAVDHIVFQLYTGRAAVANIDWYLSRLRRLGHPYKVGLLPKMATERARLLAADMPGLVGIIYFYQREG